MVVQVHRSGSRRATIFMIDGKPYLMRDAARELGMSPSALGKRLQRGTSLTGATRELLGRRPQ